MMGCREKILIIGTLIVVALAIVGTVIFNMPTKYEVVIANEVGEPLSINEVWTEQGLFEVKINEIKEIPIDSLRIGDDEAQQDYTLFDWKIKSYKGRGITRAVEVIFGFKNINYSSYKNGGFHFTVRGYGYDKDGESVKDASQGFGYDQDGAFIKSLDYLGGNNGYFWNNALEGMPTTNRLILLIEDNTSRIELEFMSPKGADGNYYKKYFYYDLPESDIEGL